MTTEMPLFKPMFPARAAISDELLGFGGRGVRLVADTVTGRASAARADVGRTIWGRQSV